ncbi:MAG TPA: TlpA family protein disulfide reductase [Nannocystis sp.]
MSEMTRTDLSPQEAARARARTYVRWAVVNVLLTTLACGLSLVIWLKEGEIRRQLGRVLQREKEGCVEQGPRVLDSKKALLVDPEEIAPPQEQPRSGYVGRYGTQISPAMLVKLEAIRDPSKPPVEVRFGSQEVLPSQAIHVVNLWATWCGPCKAEMPDFKAMFERKAQQWGGAVRFVPIQLKDNTDPRKSYTDFADIMPYAPVKLADRSYDEVFVKVLEAEEERKLFRGNLPVTFVLDCNRRVRWAKFEQLTEADFEDLEKHIDQFYAELGDTSPDAWCRKVYPGNGRCEGKENTPAHHSPEDCGDLKKRGSSGEPALLPPEQPPDPGCLAGQIRTPDGRCVARLKGTPAVTRPAAPSGPKSCGNKICEPRRGESSHNCCQDCPCDPPLVCKPDVSDRYTCQAKGLK